MRFGLVEFYDTILFLRHSTFCTYMDAPCCQAFSSISESQGRLQPIHPASVCDTRSRALMEFAGRCLITTTDC
jgi:hypothetical protein